MNLKNLFINRDLARLAQETAPNTIKLSNKSVNIIKDFATRFPSKYQ